jgi:C4-dicarboxylate-specific signal transduction histidine kinase
MMVKMLLSRQSPILVKSITTELNDEDITVFPGLLEYKSAVFIPITMQFRTSAIVILSFREEVEHLDEILSNILNGISNLASITLEKISSLHEQTLMSEALDRYERLTAMGRIIAGVAHEINNPLSIMQLDLDEMKVLRDRIGVREGESFTELMDSIQEEIKRLSFIVKQLKDYSNPEATAQEPICIDELLKNYPVKIFLKNLQKKGVEVRLGLQAGKSLVKANRNRVIQVLMNLLTNADDSVSGKTGGEIRIETGKVMKEGPMVFITIRDNGAGIADENLQKVFEPFFTTKKSEGTGLGLSISYSIVKSYNGDIHVKSGEGAGSEFTVYLPEAQADES